MPRRTMNMKTLRPSPPTLLAATAVVLPGAARASFLPPALMDSMSWGVAWFVIIVMPIAAIVLFWMVHVLPEKIAHKRHHPQKDAIQVLCLLSLVFGGLLWPIAWLWAYTKPVLHKLAYGTDQDEHDDHDAAVTPFKDASGAPQPLLAASPAAAAIGPGSAPADIASHAEIEELRRRLRALEMAVAMAPGPGRATPPTGGGAGGGKGT